MAAAIANAGDPVTSGEAVRTLELPTSHSLYWWKALAIAHDRAEFPSAPVVDYHSYVNHVAGGERGKIREFLLAHWKEQPIFVPQSPNPDDPDDPDFADPWAKPIFIRMMEQLWPRCSIGEGRACIAIQCAFAQPLYGSDESSVPYKVAPEWVRFLCHVPLQSILLALERFDPLRPL